MISKDKKAYLIVDLGFGDAGKGTLTDWYARHVQAHTVVRFNGGSQAAHNVIAPDGRHHTFSQFGSATFVPGVRTHLSRFMIVNPAAMVQEAKVLASKGVADAFARTTIHARALVTTPFHIAANRLKEIARGADRHGSCGAGISETTLDSLMVGEAVLRIGDLRDSKTLARKLTWIQRHKRGQMDAIVKICRHLGKAKTEIAMLENENVIDEYRRQILEFLEQAKIVNNDAFAASLNDKGNVIFEGSQGVLLDEWRGFHPYTTWSTCTYDNALQVLKDCGYDGQTVRVGVVRGYATRHGAGPFVTEDAELTRTIPDRHNVTDDWQEGFRVGWFDAVATRYAIRACGYIDQLAVTCMDRLVNEVKGDWMLCNRYRLPNAGHEDVAALKDAFECDSLLRCHDIKAGQHRDLSHQESITRMLARVKPDYERFSLMRSSLGSLTDDVNQYLDRIGELVGTRPSVYSAGPTSQDKCVR